MEALELGILWIQPGTGDGGGLNRKVGEDFTSRETAAGITVDGKLITWIAEVSIGAPPGPGIVAHELAHLLLGHGDMYFVFYNSAAAGAYSLMDQDGRAPHLDPFAKLKLGWLHPRVVHRGGRYRLPDVETRHVALVLPNPQARTEEYFIVENRWPGTSYDRVLPDQGLAVWHVMENPNTYNAAGPPPNVAADEWEDLGSGQWARKGIRMIRPIVTPPFDDSRALWDGSDPETGYDLLSDDPDPAHATLRWANGTPSGYSLRDISAAGPAMELTVEVPAQVPALHHGAPCPLQPSDGGGSAGPCRRAHPKVHRGHRRRKPLGVLPVAARGIGRADRHYRDNAAARRTGAMSERSEPHNHLPTWSDSIVGLY